ncbi:MAG: site-2 protease family protein, partial [Rhizobiales bacterium]|nr:site-2 protease family protein [Hyphomicrobiales bacterium]
MSWSFPLGRIAGTEVRIHITFFLLLAWFGIVAGAQGGRAAAAESILFILAVFACVLAHEFGHVLMARHYGIQTRDITLLPIGGVANIEKMPDRPGQELLIAVAGPAVNVAIVLILVAVLGVRIGGGSIDTPAGWEALGFLQRLAIVNAMLVLFNLLPAFPMDGGRVLRALLSMRLGRMKATRLATRIGQASAFGLGFLGLFGNPLLIVIAVFVFLAASQEAYAVEL